MPLLGQLIANLFAGLVGFFARFFGVRVAVRVLAVAALATAGTALMVGFNAFVSPLAAAMFATDYGQLLGLAFPPVAGTVVVGLLALWVACVVYRLQAQAIRLVASI